MVICLRVQVVLREVQLWSDAKGGTTRVRHPRERAGPCLLTVSLLVSL